MLITSDIDQFVKVQIIANTFSNSISTYTEYHNPTRRYLPKEFYNMTQLRIINLNMRLKNKPIFNNLKIYFPNLKLIYIQSFSFNF